MRAAIGLAAAVGLAIAGTGAGARAEPGAATWPPPPVYVPLDEPAEAAANISNILYLNRCRGGCTVVKGGDNALTNESSIPRGEDGQTFTISEFAHGDEVWEAIVACVRDVYAPYDVVVVTDDPAPTPHHEAIAAGLGVEIGRGDAGGVGIGRLCEPRNNGMSFSFLNGYPVNRIEYMCAVIAQESGHSFGMPDHVRDCTDAMGAGYFGPCNQRDRSYFRNKLMMCGDFADNSPPCVCGGARQNNHQHLLRVFGASAYTPPAPAPSFVFPADGASITGGVPFVAAAAVPERGRGVFRVDLFLNGWRWARWDAPERIAPQDAWPPSRYELPASGYPDGIIDAELRMYDDLGTMGTATIQVTKGAPCTDASACLAGQRCEDGRCRWDAPTGELGDACTYPQQCVGPDVYDGRCETSGDVSICTRGCYAGVNDDCPDGFACVATDPATGAGVCWFARDEVPGCCSAGADGRGGLGRLLGALLLAAGVGGLTLRRRGRG